MASSSLSSPLAYTTNLSSQGSASSSSGATTFSRAQAIANQQARIDDETRQLEDMLDVAFGHQSVEKSIWVELADEILSEDSVTPQQIGLAASYGAFRRFAMDDHKLLGGGWQPWMVQPRRGDGGKEVLECCVRYGQDLIHTLFSRARFSIREGDYSIAKETARRSLLGALVRTGDLPTDHVRRGSSSAQVWSAAEEGSILELPHLSPSLRPTELSLSPHGSPALSPTTLSPSSSSLPALNLRADPPLTPADSPQLSPKQFGLGLVGRGGIQLELAKFDLGSRVFVEEPEEGLRTPRAQDRELRTFVL